MEFPKLTTGQIAGGAGIIGLGVGLGVGTLIGSSKKRKSRKKKASSKRKNTRKKVYRRKQSKRKKLKFGSKAYRKKYLGHKKKGRRTPYTAGKRKDTSHKRIRYTKNGHPYIILANGRARFIKMSSAKRSHKLKGGRY